MSEGTFSDVAARILMLNLFVEDIFKSDISEPPLKGFYQGKSYSIGVNNFVLLFDSPTVGQTTKINSCPAEPGYALSLQTVQTQISWFLKKPTDLDRHCLPVSMWICINNLD